MSGLLGEDHLRVYQMDIHLREVNCKSFLYLLCYFHHFWYDLQDVEPLEVPLIPGDLQSHLCHITSILHVLDVIVDAEALKARQTTDRLDAVLVLSLGSSCLLKLSDHILG